VQEERAEAEGRHGDQPGDLAYTGTPSGVGPVRPGERLEAEGVGRLIVTVGEAA
jgi:fumarylpyruvate hydrolase